MGNFKAGDEAILVSVEPQWKVPVGTKVRVRETCVGGAGPGYFVELSTEPGSNIYYAEYRLGPVDDPLPPAPESVLYNVRSDQGCNLEAASLKANEYYDARIRIGVWSNRNPEQGKVTCLTPDAALQLAHDLRRMAMEIKRKEKQQ